MYVLQLFFAVRLTAPSASRQFWGHCPPTRFFFFFYISASLAHGIAHYETSNSHEETSSKQRGEGFRESETQVRKVRVEYIDVEEKKQEGVEHGRSTGGGQRNVGKEAPEKKELHRDIQRHGEILATG